MAKRGMNFDDQTLIYLLKHGSERDVSAYLDTEDVKPLDFVSYMDGFVERSGYKRNQLAQRACLSPDYLYKLLNGSKHTKERDYLLAIFFALSMTSEESQKALRMYPIEALDKKLMRDYIIMLGLDQKIGLYEVCEWLKKVNLPAIHTSSEDKEVGPAGSTKFTPAELLSESSREQSSRKKDEGDEMTLVNDTIRFNEVTVSDEEYTEVNKDIRHWQEGNAPFDIGVAGEYELEDSEGNKLYVAAIFHIEGSEYLVAAKSVWDTNGFNMNTFPVLESYETGEEAIAKSDFAKWFLQLERDTDAEIANAKKAVNDTAHCENFCRIGGGNDGNRWRVYMEVYNAEQPEKQEYIQVIKWSDGTYRFTASHKSRYMAIELDRLKEVYEMYFKEKPDIPVFEQFNSIDEMEASMSVFRYSYHQMMFALDDFMKLHMHAGLSSKEHKIQWLKEHGASEEEIADMEAEPDIEEAMKGTGEKDMSRYIILEAKCGCSEGGMACGPVGGNVVAEIKVRNEETGEEFYLSDAEVDGTVNIFNTGGESSYELQTGDVSDDDEDAWNELNGCIAATAVCYDEFFEEYPRDDEDSMVKLYYYLIYIIRTSEKKAAKYIKETVGKAINDIEVPKSDAEEEYIEEIDNNENS